MRMGGASRRTLPRIPLAMERKFHGVRFPENPPITGLVRLGKAGMDNSFYELFVKLSVQRSWTHGATYRTVTFAIRPVPLRGYWCEIMKCRASNGTLGGPISALERAEILGNLASRGIGSRAGKLVAMRSDVRADLVNALDCIACL